jgi:hypothetical protein
MVKGIRHPGRFMLESPIMTSRRFWLFFFYLPCLLADGIG